MPLTASEERPLRSALATPQALPGTIGEPATVYGEGVAVDEAAPFRIGQKGDGPGYVLGRGEAGHRGAALNVGVGVAAAGLILVIYLGSKIPKPWSCAFVLS
jgi:hypothetical protein